MNAIETSALRKVYAAPAAKRGTPRRPDVVALESLDLAVADGEFFGLLGPNGAGKTTTIAILTTRVIPTAGDAHVGRIIAPQHIGLMFSVILAPMIMFGCTYYPWRGLDAVPVLKWAVLINPLVYVFEGLRAALTPSLPHMPTAAIVAALVALSAVFTYLGLGTFRKRAVS